MTFQAKDSLRPLPGFSIEPGAAPERLRLTLVLSDPDVVAALQRLPEGEERRRYAEQALRVGVLALRMAGGQLDAAALREEGTRLVGDIRTALADRAGQMSQQLGEALAAYFDPETGQVPERLAALVRRGGEMERLLDAHLGEENSTIAKTLASHLGAGSPLFKMLSPTEADGLRAQLERTLEDKLTEQRDRVVAEFSLDRKESALSRLIGEITEGQGQLREDLQGQIEGVVREFSLDQPDSALSRLVRQVTDAQQKIADEFSTDNEASALNRLSGLLEKTSAQIDRNLTLDDEASALSRLRREMTGSVERISEENQRFHAEVRETLAALAATREEAEKSTRHGARFEEELGGLLSREAQRQGDVYQAVGTTTGLIRHCKKGDFLVELGPESSAPGARIIWEAKEQKGYDLKRALAEVEEARKNRGAQIGLFVYSKKTAPEGQEVVKRYGDSIVVLWDADDPGSDLYVRLAYSLARGLAIRDSLSSAQASEAVEQVERATRMVERQLQYLDDFDRWAVTIHSNATKIKERAQRMRAQLFEAVECLDEQLAALKQA